MVMDSEVNASLYSYCPHQIIFAKFDLKAFYPPPCERTVCQVNSDHIKRAVDLFDWESVLTDSMSKFPFLRVRSQILCRILLLTK